MTDDPYYIGAGIVVLIALWLAGQLIGKPDGDDGEDGMNPL